MDNDKIAIFAVVLTTNNNRIMKEEITAGHQDIKITHSYYATLQESTVIKEVSKVF